MLPPRCLQLLQWRFLNWRFAHTKGEQLQAGLDRLSHSLAAAEDAQPRPSPFPIRDPTPTNPETFGPRISFPTGVPVRMPVKGR